MRYLASQAEFSALVEGKGNFVTGWTGKQLSAIKEYLYEHEKRAEEISILGYQPESGHYAFAQGLFDGQQYRPANDFGIIPVQDRSYYLPAFSVVNEQAEMEYHNERKFIYQSGSSSFAGWSAHLVKVFGDNATVGICFTVAAFFREIVYTHANCFPILFLFGPRGTGKTTFRLALKRLFGNYGPKDAIGLESASSPKGFSRKLAQVRNGLEAFEEYKNSIDRKLIGMLKNIYDGIGYERAQSTNDLKTHSTPVNSAVIIAGQEMPSKENALFSRVIMLSFAQTNHGPEAKEAFNALEKMIAQGLSNVLIEIIRHRDQVRTKFQAAFGKIYGHLRQDPATQTLDERTLTNAAALLAPFRILADYLQFPFDYKEAYQVFKERILAQYELMNKTNEVNQFWQIFDYLAGRSEIVHNYDYKVEDNGEKLFIHMPSVFPKYFELARKQNINALDQATLESYLCMQTYYERPQGGKKHRNTHRKRMENGQQKRCFAFFANFLELEFLENGGLSGHRED